MKEPQYIQDKEFVKLTKKEKLALPSFGLGMEEIEIKQLVLIPTNLKMSRYGVGAFFARNKKGWFRIMNYDCWRVVTDIENPTQFRYQILQGDFEYGGVNIFGIATEHHKAFIRHGGEIIIKSKL